jgi:hypothetical protein
MFLLLDMSRHLDMFVPELESRVTFLDETPAR